MKVRTFAVILTVALGLLAAPLPAEAQRAGKVYRVGFLSPGSPPNQAFKVFAEKLRELGWVEHQNLILEARWGEGRTERLPELAAELVRLKVGVLLAVGSAATRVAMNSTTTIPIVFSMVSDPVGQGFVASLARPGGNVTGTSFMAQELGGKWLEFLKQVVPGLSRVAILWNPTNRGTGRVFKQVRSAAPVLGLVLQSLQVQHPNDFQSSFTAMARERAEALVDAGGGLTFVNRRRMAELALTNRLPTISYHRGYVEAGYLMSYAADRVEQFQRAAVSVDKILKGANPAELPVERPTQFEMVVNLKTARALGLTIPDSLLFQAGEVIR